MSENDVRKLSYKNNSAKAIKKFMEYVTFYDLEDYYLNSAVHSICLVMLKKEQKIDDVEKGGIRNDGENQ